MEENYVGEESSLEQFMQRLIEAEETIEAIKYNKVDALVISTSSGEQVWTLKNADYPYREMIEQINDGAVTISPDGTIIFSNNKFSELLNVSFENIIGSSIFKWVSISDINSLNDFFSQNIDNSKIELNLLRGDVNLLPVSIRLKRMNIGNTDYIISLIITDLTERKENEKISAAEKLARSIVEQAAGVIVVCNKNKEIIRASRGAENLAGRNLLNLPFDSVFDFTDINRSKISVDDVLKNPFNEGKEVLYKSSTGEAFNLIFKVSILSGTEDSLLGYIINLANITSHVVAEEKISKSLKEKTILLKEVHHRVKNNLQMVSSLLNLQSAYIKDPGIKEIFRESEQRIRSMALIHQKLYETKSFSSINIDEYIENLVSIICSSYYFNSNKIILSFPEDNIILDINFAVHLGLILNELITNCFKHAFSNKDEDKLSIFVVKNKEKTFSISIKDNGKGFPVGVDFRQTESLGLQLVSLLVAQLEGGIELIRDKGTEFKVTFSLQETAF